MLYGASYQVGWIDVKPPLNPWSTTPYARYMRGYAVKRQLLKRATPDNGNIAPFVHEIGHLGLRTDVGWAAEPRGWYDAAMVIAQNGA